MAAKLLILGPKWLQIDPSRNLFQSKLWKPQMAPNVYFLNKCTQFSTQFTKNSNWFYASNLLVYWFQEYGFTYTPLQIAKTCLKRSLFDDKNGAFQMVLGFRNSGCCELGLRLSSI